MSKIASHLHRAVIGLSLAALGMFSVPSLNASAQTASDPATPPGPGEREGIRLERAWFREQRTYDRLCFMFDHAQQRIERARELIDLATAKGRDTNGVRAALDIYEDAVQSARPAFESARGIIAAHKGFDAEGRMTDPELAESTVRSMAEKLREIRAVLPNPARALRDALQAFREANRSN